MIINESSTDRVIRLVLGIAFMTMGYSWSYWWYIPGVILLFTAVIGHCRIYDWLGINTNKTSVAMPVKKTKKRK